MDTQGVGVYGSRPRCGSTIPSAFIWRVQRGLAVFEIVWDPDGQPVDYVIVGLNDKFAEMFGCDAHAVVRTRVSQSLPEIMEMWQDALAVTAQSGVDQEIELFHLPTEAWLKVSLYSPAPNLVGLVVADMTAWVETAPGSGGVPNSAEGERALSPIDPGQCSSGHLAYRSQRQPPPCQQAL